jgi:hypothetical protein
MRVSARPLGYLSRGPREVFASQVDTFLQGLRDLGYVEGQTIAIEWRFAPAGNDAPLPELAGELVELSVDLIVTLSSPVRGGRQAGDEHHSHRRRQRG